MRGQQPCPPPSISGASSTFTAASPTRPTGRGPPIADWRLRSISRASRSTSSPQPSYSPLPAATTAIPRPPLSLPSTRSTTTCLLSTSSAPIRPPPATASTSAASLPLTRQTSPRRSTIKYLDRSTIKYRDRSHGDRRAARSAASWCCAARRPGGKAGVACKPGICGVCETATLAAAENGTGRQRGALRADRARQGSARWDGRERSCRRSRSGRCAMGGAAGVLLALVVVALAIAVKGLPLLVAAVEGRRIEAAVRQRDGLRLRRAVAAAAGLAELDRVLRRLPTRDLLALGDGMVEAVAEERGAQVLAAIAEVVERRDLVLKRWTRVRERRQVSAEASGRGQG